MVGRAIEWRAWGLLVPVLTLALVPGTGEPARAAEALVPPETPSGLTVTGPGIQVVAPPEPAKAADQQAPPAPVMRGVELAPPSNSPKANVKQAPATPVAPAAEKAQLSDSLKAEVNRAPAEAAVQPTERTPVAKSPKADVQQTPAVPATEPTQAPEPVTDTVVEPPPPPPLTMWDQITSHVPDVPTPVWIVVLLVVAAFVYFVFLQGPPYDVSRRLRRGFAAVRAGEVPGPPPGGNQVPLPTEAVGPADVAIGDAAITRLEQDALGTGPLARGLAMFLRNPRTEPPVTMAITGEWGTGKSSIMHMMEDDLRLAGHRSVWFNAWHHQGEEHLFGALLEAIRHKVVPSLWTAGGMRFRLRLLLRRACQSPGVAVLAMVPAGTAIYGAISNVTPEQVMVAGLPIPDDPLLAALALVSGGAVAGAARAFGPWSGRLIRAVGKVWESGEVRVDPGVRYRINRYLDDINWALGHRQPMVVFVDDLDRCPPDRVLKVLECVNFLSCPPRKNHFVMGMAMDRILPAISPEFAPAVEESLDAEEGETPEAFAQRLKQARKGYAVNYLKKMVTLEVCVPRVAPGAMGHLPKGEGTKAVPPDADEVRRAMRARIADRFALPVLGVGATALYTWAHVTDQEAPLPGLVPAQQTLMLAPGPVDGGATWVPWVVAAASLAGLVGIALGVAAYLGRRAAVTDAPGFVDALSIWAEPISGHPATPRACKRAMNQLRLLAMRARAEAGARGPADPAALADRAVRFVVLKALNETGVDGERFRASVDRLLSDDPPEEDTARAALADRLLEELRAAPVGAKDPAAPEPALASLARAAVAHRAHIGKTWPDHGDAALYDRLIAGITLP